MVGEDVKDELESEHQRKDEKPEEPGFQKRALRDAVEHTDDHGGTGGAVRDMATRITREVAETFQLAGTLNKHIRRR